MKKSLKTLAFSALLLGAKIPEISTQEISSQLDTQQYQAFTLTEKIELQNILDASKKRKLVEEVYSKSVFGISLKSMFMQFLPYLNKPNYSVDPGFELKITPNVSLEATCDPFTSIQLEGQNPKIGIYLKFKF